MQKSETGWDGKTLITLSSPKQSLSSFWCIFSHFTLFLFTRETCIDVSLHTLKNVAKREREKKIHSLKYFSPPPATEKRLRVPVSLPPHASTAHLFMEEEESKGQVWGRRRQEERSPRLRMLLHAASSMTELLFLKWLNWLTLTETRVWQAKHCCIQRFC